VLVARYSFHQRRIARRGITLLEVLISIGVAFTGLMGLVALIPLAAHFMRSGVTADNAAALGRNSISDLDVRGILRRDNWAIWNNVNANPNRFVAFDKDPQIATTPPIDTSDPAIWRGASFCIDPLLISSTYQVTGAAPNLFPSLLPAQAYEARMARVTLRSIPGQPLNAQQFEMRPDVAADLFHLNDDLVFALPGRDPGLPRDSTLPPVQTFSVDVNNNNQKRQYDGSLSWIATFSPIVRPNGGFITQDSYLMSVVVFDHRVLDLTAEPERVVDVSAFWGAGIGGGDMSLTPSPSQPNGDMKVRVGDWVMLSGRLRNPLNSNTPGASVFRWYRVVSADSELHRDTNNNIWLRDISVQGADWNPAFFASSARNFTTQATIVSGVVAVFEKTVRLEGSSLWTTSY
jgi:hypothetical protein